MIRNLCSTNIHRSDVQSFPWIYLILIVNKDIDIYLCNTGLILFSIVITNFSSHFEIFIGEKLEINKNTDNIIVVKNSQIFNKKKNLSDCHITYRS